MIQILILIKKILGSTLNYIAGAASILGLTLLVFKSKIHSLIALSFIIIFLSLILLKIIQFLDKYLKQKSEKGYINLATFSRYFTNDDKIINYEVRKFIVCKKLIMAEHEHEYHWTGTKVPQIVSDNMDFKEVIQTEAGNYDKAIFKLRNTLMFNDFSVVHIKMQMDDSDHKSKPRISHNIKAPLQLLNFKVELLHKRGNRPDAKIKRRKTNTEITSEEEFLESVPFNKLTRSYEHNVYLPEVHYSYSIEWDR